MNAKHLLSLGLTLASFAASATLLPMYDNFGPLPVATFGGTGIPNTSVAVTTLTAATTSGTVTLGLTAHQRFANAPLTNDNAGRFFAQAGVDQTNATSIAAQYATWNFAFYVGGDTSALSLYTYQLMMDIDPTAGESFRMFAASGGAAQNSWNLGFDSFETFLGYSFNPTTNGEYSFRLVALNANSGVEAESSIVVQVGNVVPEPATLALVGLALVGATIARRAKKA